MEWGCISFLWESRPGHAVTLHCEEIAYLAPTLLNPYGGMLSYSLSNEMEIPIWSSSLFICAYFSLKTQTFIESKTSCLSALHGFMCIELTLISLACIASYIGLMINVKLNGKLVNRETPKIVHMWLNQIHKIKYYNNPRRIFLDPIICPSLKSLL